jgi:hypothetical protein
MDEIEQEILAVIRERGVDRIEAETTVGMRRGELLGDNDILVLRRLTDEQKRRLGLGRTIQEVVAATQAREESGPASSEVPAAIDRSP